MRVCSGCPDHVPAVSWALALSVVQRLGAGDRPRVIGRCVDWLTTRHPNMRVYLGVCGRPYFADERESIATESWAVEQTRCPFAQDGTCLIGGLGTAAQLHREARRSEYVWLPTALLKLLDPGLLRYLTQTRVVADAKVAGMTRNRDFPIPRWSTNQPYETSSLQRRNVEVSDDGAVVQAGAH